MKKFLLVLLTITGLLFSEETAKKKFTMLVGKGIGKFIKKGIRNKIGKIWIKNMLKLKKAGYKK